MQSGLWKVVALGLGVGALASALSLPLTGKREIFDSGYYYPVAAFFAGMLAALPAPRYWMAAVFAVFVGEHLYYAAVYPEVRPWLLFGIFMNMILPVWLFTAAGAFMVWRGMLKPG